MENVTSEWFFFDLNPYQTFVTLFFAEWLTSLAISPVQSVSEVTPIMAPQSAGFSGTTLNISPPTVTMIH